MFQKGKPAQTFFNMKALAPRPVSDATEMFDTDFEDDESDAEADSPRLSLNSVCCALSSDIFFLTDRSSLVEGVRLLYRPLRKYIHRAPTRMSSRDSTLIWLRKSR
jgi:hypothetical protein